MNPLLLAALLLAQSPAAPQSVDLHAADRAQARARYQKVELELAAARIDRLSPEQRAARARLLEVLDAYVAKADFGLQDEVPGARVPQFVDDDGRRCAVAELLHATGEDALVAGIARQNNTAWVVELSGDAQFLAWLERHGLALEEAARIQGPSLPPIPREPPPVYNGPGDTRPAPGTPAGPGGDSLDQPLRRGTPGPGTPYGPVAPGAGPVTPGSPGPATPGFGALALTEGDSSWWQWWEFNKQEFLRPNRLELAAAGDDAVGRSFSSQLDFMRRAMAPSLVRLLTHPDARLRAAAAGALGRMGDGPAVERLLPLLSDANQPVRDAAMLGLGASGTREAQPVLMRIASEGKLGSAREFGRRDRAVALVALGLGRQSGFEASADDLAVELATRGTSGERAEFGVAAMTYALLCPSEKLLALAQSLSADKSAAIAVRARAVEALRALGDAATLASLQHLASGSRIELRRSAALALGEFRHPLVAAGLMTSHDLEKEPVASSFLLVSLGRRGGERARAHLLGALREGGSADRPWAALGLGILARHAGCDAALAKALLDGLAAEPNADTRAAIWLALGLSRTPEAAPVLIDALRGAADPRARMYAAQALALHGDDAGRAALAAQLDVERSALARSQLALALGALGAKSDLDRIAATLESVSEPLLQGQVAAAIAFHGSSDALTRLAALVASEKHDVAARAAAVDGLGMMLGRTTPLSLAGSARSSNFPLFPDWLREAYTTTF